MFKPLILAAVVLAGAGTALAQSGGGPRDRQSPLEMLTQADTNGDGRITTAEFDVLRGQQFTRMDRNGDGFLTPEDRPERAATPGAPGAGGAERRRPRSDQGPRGDTDGDGKISRAEFLAQPRRGFEMGDTNRDGVIDQAELTALRERMAARRNPS